MALPPTDPPTETPGAGTSNGVVVLVGSLDTKADEYAFAVGRLEAAGLQLHLIDTGVMGEARDPRLRVDTSSREVAAAGGGDLDALRAAADRGAAQRVMAAGARAVVERLHAGHHLVGAFAMGGTGGTAVAASAFASLPVGMPKVVLSTAASGNTAPYVGESDLVLVPSVVDVAGLNRISRRVMANAVSALAGMVGQPLLEEASDRPLVAASMFGVTTPCVTRAREGLEALGYEVVVFHMTGSGGRAMEALVRGGYFAGVLDLTTTELADELVGGVFSAGPGRLTGAVAAEVPQVVSLGALDMVNFGPRDTLPQSIEQRLLHVHNSSVTLVRTTAEECGELGRRLADRLRDATAPTTVLVPAGGTSAISVPGGPFHDPEADRALFAAVCEGLAGSAVRVVRLEEDINDPAFAERAVDELHRALQGAGVAPAA